MRDDLFDLWIADPTALTYDEWLIEREKPKPPPAPLLTVARQRAFTDQFVRNPYTELFTCLECGETVSAETYRHDPNEAIRRHLHFIASDRTSSPRPRGGPLTGLLGPLGL